MNIHLPKDLEKFVRDSVRSGQYAREDDVIHDAVSRLKQSTPPQAANLKSRSSVGESARPTGPISQEGFNQLLLKTGLVTQLPDPAQDIDDADDLPIVIEGEPLSETILRERR